MLTLRRNSRSLSAGLVIVGLAVCFSAILSAQKAASYTRALSGWLYVMVSDDDTQTGRVLVVDPARGRVVRELIKRYEPDLLPSLDGARLFVSSDRPLAPPYGRLAGAFEVVDAVSGSVLLRLDEAEPRGAWHGAYPQRMALSRDGVWLFRYKSSLSETTGRSYWIETFDTVRNVMLPEKAPLPLCGEATLLPSAQRDVLFVVCPDSEDVRVLTLTSSAAAADKRPPRLDFGPGAKPNYPLPAFLRNGQNLTVIKTNGSFVRFDTASRSVIQRDTIDRVARGVEVPRERPDLGPRTEAPSPTDWFAGGFINHGAVLSPDGSRIYTLVGRRSPPSAEITVLDAATLERIRAIPFTRPYVDLTISHDGAHLYAIDRDNGLIVVIDTASGQEVRVISGVGPGPIFAVVAP